MISKKIQLSGLINIEDNDMDLHSIIDKLTYSRYDIAEKMAELALNNNR
jgi:hypothetical protein